MTSITQMGTQSYASISRIENQISYIFPTACSSSDCPLIPSKSYPNLDDPLLFPLTFPIQSEPTSCQAPCPRLSLEGLLLS